MSKFWPWILSNSYESITKFGGSMDLVNNIQSFTGLSSNSFLPLGEDNSAAVIFNCFSVIWEERNWLTIKIWFFLVEISQSVKAMKQHRRLLCKIWWMEVVFDSSQLQSWDPSKFWQWSLGKNSNRWFVNLHASAIFFWNQVCIHQLYKWTLLDIDKFKRVHVSLHCLLLI